MAIRRWKIAQSDKEKVRDISERFSIPHFAAHLLMSRGISEDSEIERMLMPMQQPLSDPFELIDMDKAVTRIRRAIDKHESMAIYGDYDVDGITATSLLYSYLCERDAKVTYMLPSRDEDGYGLHKKQIDELARFGVKLIITVDNGISAVEEVEYANSLGMDVVITDHHQPPDVLPDACAIVDAHRCDCPSSFKDYAGVGIAFKLVCALEGDSESVADKYADFVALGTVADVVPLRGENRSLVMRGLRLMQQESRLGLSVLMTFSSVNARRVSSGDISFVLSPRINSAGRIGKPDKAVRLMVSEDMEECRAIASELQSENARRHECERDIAKEAWQLIEKDRSILYDPVIVLCGEGWIHGVVGIFAARLCEQLGKPCIILSSDGEIAKGSGRCFGDFSLHEALTACAEHLIVYGGHKLAAGLTLRRDKVEDFRRAINDYAKQWGEMPVPELLADCELKPSNMRLSLMYDVQMLEPFGSCNPSPLVAMRGVTIRSVFPVSGGNHQRVTLGDSSGSVTAMYFNISTDSFPFVRGDTVDCIVAIGINEYRESVSLSCIIRDMRLSDTDVEVIIKGERTYDSLLRGDSLPADVREAMIPSREELGDIYRYLRVRGYHGSIDVLATRMSRKGITYERLMTAIYAMEQSGVIHVWRRGGVYSIRIVRDCAKVNLEESEIYRLLRSE